MPSLVMFVCLLACLLIVCFSVCLVACFYMFIRLSNHLLAKLLYARRPLIVQIYSNLHVHLSRPAPREDVDPCIHTGMEAEPSLPSPLATPRVLAKCAASSGGGGPVSGTPPGGLRLLSHWLAITSMIPVAAMILISILIIIIIHNNYNHARAAGLDVYSHRLRPLPTSRHKEVVSLSLSLSLPPPVLSACREEAEARSNSLAASRDYKRSRLTSFLRASLPSYARHSGPTAGESQSTLRVSPIWEYLRRWSVDIGTLQKISVAPAQG